MDLINEYLEKLVKLIGGVKDEREMLVRIIIGCVLFALVIVFKSQLSKLVISIINALFFKKSENAQKAVKSSLLKPLAYFWCIMAFYGAICIIIPTGADSNKLVTLVKLVSIVLVGWFGINLINSDYSFVLSKDDSASKKTAVRFASNLLKIVILLIVSLLVLEQFGISATRIFAALGIGGVAVAFACKDAVENLLSGFIVIYDKPFKVDDYIEIDGVGGTVEDITMRTTRIRCDDGSQKIYPNTAVANAEITNWTNISFRLIDESVALNYAHTSDELDAFIKGIKALVENEEHSLKDNIRIYFDEFGESALEIHICFKVDIVNKTDYLNYKGAFNLKLKQYAEQNNVNMAFPTRTVHMVNE